MKSSTASTSQPKKTQQSAASQKEELINNILILQKNILRFQDQLETEKQTRIELFKQYTDETGQKWNKNERRYNKLPNELKEEQKDNLHTSMREAYAQDSKVLMEKVILRVEES